MARKSKFTPELAETICARIAGGESLRKICEDKDMPHADAVRKWLVKGDAEDAPEEFKAFLAQYVRAREDQADYYADDIVHIADTEEDPAKARVRVDARKWVASKLKAKKYGDRVTNTHEGPDGKPVSVTHVHYDFSDLQNRWRDKGKKPEDG